MARKRSTTKKKTTRRRSRKPAEDKAVTLEVRRMKLEDLQEHPENVHIRKHPLPDSPKWNALKKSLRHDYFDPIVWNEDNGFLVSGHLRRKVLLEDEVIYADVVVVNYDDETHKLRMLAANKSVGDDDTEGQKDFLKELGEIEDLDLEGLSGFSMPELEDMDIFPDPDFDFHDEDEEAMSVDPDEDEDSESAPGERGIKYLQLIYGQEEYGEFKELLTAYQEQNRDDLEEEFGEDWKDLASVCLHMLRNSVE